MPSYEHGGSDNDFIDFSGLFKGAWASSSLQLELFSDPEREQFERNKNFLRERLSQIPEEIKRVTETIKTRFADPQSWMFPVAVTFLVPKRMAK